MELGQDFVLLLPVSLYILLLSSLQLGFILVSFSALLLNVFALSLCPCRDLVSSQRTVSTTTTPSRNFFSTFLPQGRRTPGKSPQFPSGSSPSQVAVGRKDPPTNPVRAGLVFKCLSLTAQWDSKQECEFFWNQVMSAAKFPNNFFFLATELWRV